MAPLREPAKLQILCLESISELVLLNALDIVKNFNWDNSKVIKNYVENFIPIKFRSDVFHIAINKLSTRSLPEIKPETIVILIDVLVHPTFEKLKLSDLAYAGSTSYDILDKFEDLLSYNLPILPNLSFLDLSTHRTESSLPSCSYNLLRTIGHNFSNLKVLDLNHNNRVTGEGLECLGPSKYSKGCQFLEKIFLQNSSVTRDDIVWLLFTFKNLRKVGYSDMGTVLQMYKTACRRRRIRRPSLKLVHIDNSESTSCISDSNIIQLVNQICPYANNLRIRVYDEDCIQLYDLKTVTKLELRFYTGVHHPIGEEALQFFRTEGYYLKSLTIYCDLLESNHVTTVASTCSNLTKLFLHANTFEESDSSMLNVPNTLSKLQLLSIRIGKHEMDYSHSADTLAAYLMGSCYDLQEVYLLFCCSELNNNFLHSVFTMNPLSSLKLIICDAPRRNLDLPVLSFNLDSAIKIIESCAKIETIGNLISWSISQSEVGELRKYISEKNYKVNIIHDAMNKMNKKYF